MEYPDAFKIIDDKVRPVRQRTNPDGSYVLRKPLPQRWWQYAEKQPALHRAIAKLDRVLVIALMSKTGLPVWQPKGQVFSHALGVFATNRSGQMSILSSSIHFHWWTTKGASSLRTDPRYTPSDGFETFPQPTPTERLDKAGDELDRFRRDTSNNRRIGLTALYNLVHDVHINDDDIARIRAIHLEIDEATREATLWTRNDNLLSVNTSGRRRPHRCPCGEESISHMDSMRHGMAFGSPLAHRQKWMCWTSCWR